MMEMDDSENEPIALYVIVVGFHHKKGMQVEYAYPPLKSVGDDFELPEKWKHLPSLCLPDGAHNHEADTVYFHLPHLEKEAKTVFGVSCYRQIDAEKVANKTADITRNTVQKSVCVLTTLPIYGYVQERLKVTTKVYFTEADFSNVQDLEGLYHDLNTINWKDKLLHGICVSEVVQIFGRNILVLFKLLLLERKVLFYHSPVGPLVKTIASLLALLPANLPDGLTLAAATKSAPSERLLGSDLLATPDKIFPNGSVSSLSNISCDKHSTNQADELSKLDLSKNENNSFQKYMDVDDLLEIENGHMELISENIDSSKEAEIITKIINVTSQSIESNTSSIAFDKDDLNNDIERRSSNSSLTSVTSRGSIMSPVELTSPLDQTLSEATPSSSTITTKISSLKGRLSGALNYWTGREKAPNPAAVHLPFSEEKPSTTATPNPSPSEPDDDGATSPISGAPLVSGSENSLEAKDPNFQRCSEKFALIEADRCGLPLQIFCKGNLVHPYLSLQYLDLLNQATTRAFIVGTSNTLFIHKRNLYDVLIELENGKIEVSDIELKRQLSLSTEDLRFAENIVRQVEAVSTTMTKSPSLDGFSALNSVCQPDVFLEGVGWVGGEEWLRHQFKIYLVSLLRSSLCDENSKENEYFNNSFLMAWKETHNYRMWLAEGPYEDLLELPIRHPHAGNLSMTDMRIRLSHTIQGFDKNKRLNQTLLNTGTAVVKTKEAVGGALTSAKGALSNFWSSFTTHGADETAIEAAEFHQMVQMNSSIFNEVEETFDASEALESQTLSTQ